MSLNPDIDLFGFSRERAVEFIEKLKECISRYNNSNGRYPENFVHLKSVIRGDISFYILNINETTVLIEGGVENHDPEKNYVTIEIASKDDKKRKMAKKTLIDLTGLEPLYNYRR